MSNEPKGGFDFNGGTLPPGCTSVDLHRGVSRLDDLAQSELWRRLDERQRWLLFRRFFREQWDELSAALDDHCQSRGARSADLGNAIYVHWLAWRDQAVSRMAMNGQIQGAR